MFGKTSSPTGTVWICYSCLANGNYAIEGRRLFSLQLNDGSEQATGEADIIGNGGTFVTGKPAWNMSDMQTLSIGEQTFTINDCTKDFLKITGRQDRTTYLFIAQQSRSLI